MAKYQGWSGLPYQYVPEDLSILDVIKFGTVDYKLAGLFWLMMEQRASVIVAAGPAWIGKTTMLNALLDFLPPDVDMRFLKGYFEDFSQLNGRNPEKTYLVAEEISNHQYEYLWGQQVTKTFNYVVKGHAFGTTTHARNIQEVAYILNALGVKPDVISRLGLIVTMQYTQGKRADDEPIRFVDTVSTLAINGDNLIAHILASKHLPESPFSYTSEKDLHEVLTKKFGVKYPSITEEIEKRGNLLRDLDAQKISHKELRRAIADFYRAKQR